MSTTRIPPLGPVRRSWAVLRPWPARVLNAVLASLRRGSVAARTGTRAAVADTGRTVRAAALAMATTWRRSLAWIAARAWATGRTLANSRNQLKAWARGLYRAEDGARLRGRALLRATLPAWSWILAALVLACLAALGWLTWEADRLVQRSVQIQQDQLAAWEVATLQRELLRLESGVSAATGRGAVRNPAERWADLQRVIKASAVLSDVSERQGDEASDWQPLVRRIGKLLPSMQAQFEPFLTKPAARGPQFLAGLREVSRLTQELALRAYTSNVRQASHTTASLGKVQRYLGGVQGLLVMLMVLLIAAIWFSLRERLESAHQRIHAQKVVETELREAKEQAEAASRVKSDFLASMSHELRTPLTGMLGYLELIQREAYGKVPKRIREAIAKSGAQGNHLLNLVNDVLDLSRIEANRMPLNRERLSPKDSVLDAVQQLEVLAQEKGLHLEVADTDDLPLLTYDRRRISQVLINLVGNAIKFTESGSVRVHLEAYPSEIRYGIADTGIGIAPERIATLFIEFQQVDSQIARSAPGAGLGLAITKRLVEMHGGRVWVESKPGVGSTFWFALPRDEPHGET